MTIIYLHGVKVRSPEHGQELRKSFARWLGPKLSVNGAEPGYEPVYWGDLAARFRWDLASRPKSAILGMGGAGDFAGLGSLRAAGDHSPLDRLAAPEAVDSPVLGAPVAPAMAPMPPLASLPLERRGDFLADLYLACRPTRSGEDPVAEDPLVAGLAEAAAQVADQWDALVSLETNDEARAQRLVSAVDAVLKGDRAIAMGAFADWMTNAGERLRRAAVWPGDAVSTVFGELRPTLNEFIAYFVGDVLTYLNERGDRSSPGDIPNRVLAALRRAQNRKAATGEKIIIVSHSMGGQLVYDALTYFIADSDQTLVNLEVDHWFTCGSQVSLFAEMRLFLGQAEVPAGTKLPMPARVRSWTNYYDRNDFVGFVMEPVYQGVKDLSYDTGYGLAFAHTGFLARPSFFQALAERL
jgi:alpha-beta hydrolase superfamily lysophospholipase